MPESSASLPAYLILETRMKMGITDTEELPDEQIISALYSSLYQHNPNYVWTAEEVEDGKTVIPEYERYVVMWLTMSNLYLELAGKYGDAVNFSVEQGELRVDLSDILENYLKLAKEFARGYEEDDLGKTGRIKVFNLLRRSHATGKIAELYEDEKP